MVNKVALVDLVTNIILEELKQAEKKQGEIHAADAARWGNRRIQREDRQIPQAERQILSEGRQIPRADKRVSQTDRQIPVGVSNRHVHLSPGHVEILFGSGTQLTRSKELSQPGQYACQETLTLVGPKGVLEKVRVMGPAREYTQVEISVSDCFKLGIQAPIRDSGDLECSAGITVVGTVGSVTISQGCIIARRHIHMHTGDAVRFCLKDGDRIAVRAHGPRGVTYSDVLVRVSDKYRLEMHVDLDEANAVGLNNGDLVEILC